MEITPGITAIASPATPKSRTSKVRSATSAEPTQSAAPKRPKAPVTASPAATDPVANNASKPKKVRTPKRSATAESVAPATARRYPSAAVLSGMISQAAFFIAAQRNFAPGNELDDWLRAEREILSHFAQ